MHVYASDPACDEGSLGVESTIQVFLIVALAKHVTVRFVQLAEKHVRAADLLCVTDQKHAKRHAVAYICVTATLLRDTERNVP